MTSFTYKSLEALLRLGGLQKKTAKIISSGRQASSKPRFRVKNRWTRSEFRGRDIWTCGPKNRTSDQVYIHQHGGAYAIGLMGLQYMAMTRLADMSGTTIIMPDYPLLGEAGAEDLSLIHI